MSSLFRSNRLRSLLKPRYIPHLQHLRFLHVPPISEPYGGPITATAGAIVATAIAVFFGSSAARNSSFPSHHRLQLPILVRLDDLQPDSPSDLTGLRLLLHDRVRSFIHSGDLDSAAVAVGSLQTALRYGIRSIIESGHPDLTAPAVRISPNTQPHLFTCNAVLSALLDAKRYSDVLALFVSFLHSGIVPDVDDSIYRLMVAFCDAGHVEYALELYIKVVESALFVPSPATHQILVKGLIVAGRIHDAIHLLKMMVEREDTSTADSVIHEVLTKDFSSCHDGVDKIFELFDELKRQYTECDIAARSSLREFYSSIVRFLLDSNELPSSTSQKLADFLNIELHPPSGEHGDPPGPKTAVKCYRRLLDWGFYQSLLNPSTLNALLRGLLENNAQVPIADKLFDRMLEYHNPPSLITVNAETCDIMVDQRLKEGKLEEAIQLLHRTVKNAPIMDLARFKSIIGKLRKRGMDSEMQRHLYDEMPDGLLRSLRNTCDYESLIDNLLREGRLADANNYFVKMVQTFEPVDVRVHNKMLYGLIKAERFGSVVSLVRLAVLEITRQQC